jgi:D-alanyl-D-alanine carboxypeptidase
MPTPSSRAMPLRGNGYRFECFLGPDLPRGRRAVRLSIHRKSDGALLASGTLRRIDRILRLHIDHAVRDFAPGPVHRELSRLLASRYPRHLFEISRARGRSRASETGHAVPPMRKRPARRHKPDAAARRLAAVRAEVPSGYGAARALAPHREPRWLCCAGIDHAGRECWLTPDAMRAWRRMADAARVDGIELVLVSGFRSEDYQTRILAAKRARGVAMIDVLAVNAAPGYSEHHSGRALDLTAPGCPPAEPGFEATAAFRWLAARAGEFGFRMSYPRGNPHGIVPEPWHWCFVGFGTPPQVRTSL